MNLTFDEEPIKLAPVICLRIYVEQGKVAE